MSSNLKEMFRGGAEVQEREALLLCGNQIQITVGRFWGEEVVGS